MADSIESIRQAIADHPSNQALKAQGYAPLFAAGSKARIVVIGHAPGIKTQMLGIPWSDASGQRLLDWMGISEATFRDTNLIAQIPMDFYYQGKGKSGDLPPRKDFAPLWHPRLFALMPDIRLKLLVGQYAQRYYLGKLARKNLTQTVQAYQDYLPDYFPIVHPSPLNFRWLMKNPWFEADLLPHLRQAVAQALSD